MQNNQKDKFKLLKEKRYKRNKKHKKLQKQLNKYDYSCSHLKFKKSDSKNFNKAFLTKYGKQQVKKADEIIKESKKIDINNLDWPWLKFNKK